MTRTRSRWSSARVWGGAALATWLVGLVAVPGAAHAQDDDADVACRAFTPAGTAECRLAVGAARVIQPRLAAALFGGNPVPGTASTLGMRIGSLPRMSVSLRVTAAPAELPPILDRARSEGERAFLTGLGAQASMGILTGFSPLPTVGGVLSLDAIARLAILPLAADGFHDGAAWGWAVGARLGALRESFTLPGVSLTGTYAGISRTAYGDPDDGTTAGFFDGAVHALRADLAATKRLGLIGVTAGVAWDRYASDLVAGFREGAGAPPSRIEGDAVNHRWSAYANASWTLMIFHAAAELGWQESPVPAGLPAGTTVDPVGWFAGLAFRVSI
ncbi:MAG TPA: hypothetical protein VMM83_07315 [Longimicrobiales bacterium]|nr:hypothetical protein [Longimicrobiales bacterium]